MSEDNSQTAGQSTPNTSAGTENAGGESAPKTVPYERFSEINTAKRDAEKRAKDLETQLAQYQNAEKQNEEKKAIERGEFDKVLGELRPKAERAALLEAELSETLAAELKEVPEDYRELIPDGDIVAKLKWVRKAKATGLFAQRRAPGLDGGAGGTGGTGGDTAALTPEDLAMIKKFKLDPKRYAEEKKKS